MLAAIGSPRSIAAAARSTWRISARRGVRRPSAGMVLGGVVVAAASAHPGQQRAAAGGRQPAGQLGGERRSPSDRRSDASSSSARASSSGPAAARTMRCLDGGQRFAGLPAGSPDPGPVQQRQELEDGPPLFRYRQRLLGELFRGVEVPPFQALCRRARAGCPRRKSAGRTQPPGIRMSGPGGISGLGQAAGLQPGQRPRTGHQHQPGRFSELGRGQNPPLPHVPPPRSPPGTGRHAGGSAGRRRSIRPAAASAPGWPARQGLHARPR